jgi:hypothetical protein
MATVAKLGDSALVAGEIEKLRLGTPKQRMPRVYELWAWVRLLHR